MITVLIQHTDTHTSHMHTDRSMCSYTHTHTRMHVQQKQLQEDESQKIVGLLISETDSKKVGLKVSPKIHSKFSKLMSETVTGF